MKNNTYLLVLNFILFFSYNALSQGAQQIQNALNDKLYIADTTALHNEIVSGAFTNAKARSALTGTSGVSYNTTTGVISGGYSQGAGITIAAGTISTAKRQEVYSGTTNGSGVYTVIFGTAYSVAPNVQVSISNQATTNQYCRVSAVSTTGFTINAYAFNTNNLLGIISLLNTTSSVSSLGLDVLVTEK